MKRFIVNTLVDELKQLSMDVRKPMAPAVPSRPDVYPGNWSQAGPYQYPVAAAPPAQGAGHALYFDDKRPTSRLIQFDQNLGQLVYAPYDKEGDRILDFSYAGYGLGLSAIPKDVQPATFVEPSPDQNTDDTKRIQDAINHVSQLPMSPHGFRGTVQLGRGSYKVTKPLSIKASGVVFKGCPEGGTELVSFVEPILTHVFLTVSGEGHKPISGTRVTIDVDYLPVGSMTIPVSRTRDFSVGDSINLAVTYNDDWIKTLGMDNIQGRAPWSSMRIDHLRRVKYVNHNAKTVTINAPITTAIIKKYGGGYMQKLEERRLHNVGIQDMEFVLPNNANRTADDVLRSDKDLHPKRGYRFAKEEFDNYVIFCNHIEDGWIRNVRSKWFRNFIRIKEGVVGFTVENAHHTYPFPAHHPKPYLVGQSCYELSGQLVLFSNCSATHSFHAFIVMGRVAGPNAFVRCWSTGKEDNADNGPHMKWSSGQLYDNLRSEGKIMIQNRYDAGGGHGWTAANSVVWNSVSDAGVVVQQPPTAQNFLIGSTSKRAKARLPDLPSCWEEHKDKPVWPESLYEAQLECARRNRV